MLVVRRLVVQMHFRLRSSGCHIFTVRLEQPEVRCLAAVHMS